MSQIVQGKEIHIGKLGISTLHFTSRIVIVYLRSSISLQDGASR